MSDYVDAYFQVASQILIRKYINMAQTKDRVL